MYELSLFTGAGGGLLGTRLLGWHPVGYVEINDYCQRVIAQRIRDGILPNAPIFGNIKTFISDGYAASYTGLVDCITAGFPCQPFSCAGQHRGEGDERNLWPETAECIRIVRPRYCLLENVPNLLAHGYYGTILGDLAALGYGVRWGVLSACAFGAPHTRERLFILAYAGGVRCEWRSEREGGSASIDRGKTEEWTSRYIEMPTSLQTSIWDTAEVDVLGVVDGVGAKVERIRATGNGQVPVVVRAAWRLLSGGES